MAAPPMIGGENTELGGLEGGLEATNLLHSESMELTNDPRFFQDNILNYRLTAFGAMSVVSGLMVQNAMDHLFDMKKKMTFMHPQKYDEVMQLIAFLMLGAVLFLNLVSTYVGVAQPYHVIRLMTGGPVGFEAAALYYLNKNIAAWRHFAVAGALLSLPLFVLASACRMVFKFEDENHEGRALPASAPREARILGWVMFSYFMLMALTLVYIHRKHFAVFQERYDAAKPTLAQHGEALDIMSSRLHRPTPRTFSR